MRKLLYAGQDCPIIFDLQKRLDGQYGIHVCVSGPDAIEDFLTFLPDVLVADMNFPGCDTVGLLRAARSRGGQTKIIILTAGHIRDPLMHIGPDRILVQPATAEDIAVAIEACGTVTLQDRVDGLLQQLGLECGSDGFVCLRDGILYKHSHPDCLFTTDLCVYVAKKNNTTAQSADKAMSRCLQKVWKDRNVTLWSRYFPDAVKAVTCNAFIGGICAYLQQEE